MYPYNYNYQYPQTNYQQSNTTSYQSNNGLVWVQGEAGAKSYLVAPSQTVLLMDSEAEKFYIKSADAAGMPMPLRVFEYTEQADNKEQYATRKEYEELAAKCAELERRLSKPATKGRKDDEPAV